MPQFKLSDREKILAVATACFAIFYLFYQSLLLPKWNEVGKLKDKARVQRLEFRVAEGKIKILDAVGKEFNPPQTSELSRDEKALEFLKLLSQATAQSGLEVGFIKPLLEANAGGIKFDLSCSGRYRSLHNFIYSLSHLNLLVLIDNLEVSSNGGTEPALDVKMSLTVFN